MTRDELRHHVVMLIKFHCYVEDSDEAGEAADAIIPLVTAAVWPWLAEAAHHHKTEHERMALEWREMAAHLNTQYAASRAGLNPPNTRYNP